MRRVVKVMESSQRCSKSVKPNRIWFTPYKAVKKSSQEAQAQTALVSFRVVST